MNNRSAPKESDSVPSQIRQICYAYSHYITGVLLLIAFLSFHIRHKDDISSTNKVNYLESTRLNTGEFNRVQNLRELIHKTSISSYQSGSLKSIKVEKSLIYDKSLEFIILRKAIGSESTSPSLTSSSSRDPLAIDTIESSLIVHKFSLSTRLTQQYPYTITLNKYNTIHDHCLIISDEFIPQMAPIEPMEFELLYWSIASSEGVGFFNSNKYAGASQPHRHLQFIPLDSIWSLRNPDATYPLPIDKLILPNIESNKWKPLTRKDLFSKNLDNLEPYFHRIKEFPFDHSLVVLEQLPIISLDDANQSKKQGQYLHSIYHRFLSKHNFDTSAMISCANLVTSKNNNQDILCAKNNAYNFILTEKYFLFVPRQENADPTFNLLNSMGFLGLLYLNQPKFEEIIKSKGAISILSAASKGF